MPLLKGKSEKAFKQNVKTEYEAGKPLKQSLAIAYSMKKKAKKMAEGGEIESAMRGEQSAAHECDMCGGAGCPSCNEEHESDRHDSAGEPMMAEGGQITDNYNSPSTKGHQTKGGSVDPEDAWTPIHEGDHKRPNSMAMSEDDRDINQHGEIEEGPQGGMYASGGYVSDGTKENARASMHRSNTLAESRGVGRKVGQVPGGNPKTDHEYKLAEIKKQKTGYFAEGGQITDNEQSDAHEMDMVGRIMKQRQQMFSKGGQVANNTDRDEKYPMPHRDDMGSGHYDDLVNRDELSFSYTGANSGDELSSPGEDERRRDIVSRVMASRRKKDRLPNPR